MNVYYEQAEFQPGRHRILAVWTDRFGGAMPNPQIAFSVMQIDEKYNSSLAPRVADIISWRFPNPDIPAYVEHFYIDNGGLLRDETGALVPVVANPNKADWVASVLAGATDAQIDAWFTNNVTTLAQARTVMAMMAKLIARLARQAGFE